MALVQYVNEYKRLRKVALYRPLIREIEQEDAERAMYISLPDPKKVIEECDVVAQEMTKLGIEVVIVEPDEHDVLTSNMIFLRDVAYVFRDKLLLANMKFALRQAEPAKLRRLLGGIDPAYEASWLAMPRGITMEGADLLTVTERLTYAYTGNRTGRGVVRAIEGNFDGVAVRTIAANIHGVPQHILGGVHILDKRLASRRIRYCCDELQGFEFIDFDEDDEISRGFALNIVTIGPREILMPAANPRTKSRLEAYGIMCHEVAISEIHKMGGGLACMTLPLYRNK